MLLVEIPLIYYSGAALGRIGVRGLLAIGVIADGFRWLVCSLVSDLSVMYALQLLHGVVIAGLFVGSALYVEAAVPERLRSTGQGLLAMIGFSCRGGVLEHLGGLLLEHFGAGRALSSRRHRRTAAGRGAAADPAQAERPEEPV